LFSTDGVTLLASDDDSPLDPGSDNGFDSNLTYTFGPGGVYYLRVDRFPGGAAPTAGSSYTLNVSLGGAVVTPQTTGSILDGGTGADVMTGNVGNDIFYVDNAADVVNEAPGGGTDTIFTSVSYTLAAGQEIEYLRNNAGATGLTLTGNAFDNNIFGGTGNDILRGMAGTDHLTGQDGNDNLDGGTGADVMAGGAGDDRYTVDNTLDMVNEAVGGGTDTVFTTVNYTLQAGQEVEYLRNNAGATGLTLTGNAFDNNIIGGTGNDTLIGGAGTDHLTGQDGNDNLDGGTGADIMNGGAGNDTYHVDNAADVVGEGSGGGTDTVFATASYTLQTGQEIEFLRNSAGATGLALTGNAFDNTIVGGTGNDTLNGGAGNDTLNGGAGLDTYLFNTALNAATNVDLVVGFSVADDHIQLAQSVFTAAGAPGTLDPTAFVIGAAALDASDRIIYNNGTGALSYDSDGTGANAAVQFATLNPGLALTNNNFQVV